MQVQELIGSCRKAGIKTLLLDNNTSPELIFSPLQSNSRIVIAKENEAYFIKVAWNHRELRSLRLINCDIVPRTAAGKFFEGWAETAGTLGSWGGVRNLQVLVTSVAAGHIVDKTQEDFLTIH